MPLVFIKKHFHSLLVTLEKQTKLHVLGSKLLFSSFCSWLCIHWTQTHLRQGSGFPSSFFTDKHNFLIVVYNWWILAKTCLRIVKNVIFSHFVSSFFDEALIRSDTRGFKRLPLCIPRLIILAPCCVSVTKACKSFIQPTKIHIIWYN